LVDETDGKRRPRAKQDRIRESEERFRALTEHSTDPISEISQDRRIVYVSPSFTKTFGYAPEEVLGKDAMLHVHPDDLAQTKAIHSEARVNDAVSQLLFRYRHKNGSWRWVELTGCPYVSASGEIRAILVNRDVTDRVADECELQAQLDAERRIAELSRYFLTVGTEDFEAGFDRGLRAASELAGADRVQFFAIDRESQTVGKYFHWSAEGIERREPDYSQEMIAQYRWSAAKLLRGEVIDVPRVPDLPPEAAAERDSLIEEGVRSYLAIPLRHGDTTLGCLDFFCLQRERRWSYQEITRLRLLADIFASALRRHRAETSRRETEHRFKTLADHTSDSICELAADGSFLYASPSFYEICGYSPDELLATDPRELVHPDDRASVRREYAERLIAETRTATVRFRMRHRDGSWRWLESTARPFRAQSGEDRVAVVFRDVTSRQQAQIELEQQLALERRLAKLSREFLDRGADEIDAGIQRAIEVTGEFAGADRGWLVAMAGEGDSGPQHYEWCTDGVPPRPMLMDLQDRDQQLWILRQLASGEAVRIPRTADLPDEVRAVRDGLLEDGVRSFLAVPIRSGETLIGVLGFQSVRSERDWSDREISLFQLVAGMFTSALRRKRAESHLRESEERFRALAEHAKDPICEVDQFGKFLYASPSFTDLLGYEGGEISRLNLFSLIHPADFGTMREAYGGGRLNEVSPGAVVYRARHKNGEWIVLEGTARVFHGASGETRMVAVIRDVTDRQRARQALERQLDLETRIAALSRRFLSVGTDEIDQTIRESLADLAALADTDRSWLFFFDPTTGGMLDIFEWHSENVPSQESDLTKVDPHGFPWTARQLFRGQVVQIPDPAALPPEAELERRSLEGRGVRSFLGIPLHSGDAPVGFLGFETADRRKSWSAESITLLRLVGEIFVTALQRKNIEENLRNSQLQLVQAQKMEAVGTLAGGIAHDFNNQLTVMLGNARYVLRHVEDDPDLKDALTDLNRAAEHCAQLTRSLLAFSRRNAISTRSLDVSAVVAEVQELLRPLIPNSIDFEVTPPAGVDWVEADPTQLQQVLVNLAVNARDAMPHGGRLVITTRNRTVDADTAARLGLPKPGAYAELGVMDTGSGIDEATRERIFEPFFTTKPLGEGTGLGLATAYGIVKESGGAIEVDTAVGSGTTFRVLLPSSFRPAPADGVEVAPSAPSGSGTILVVEDESAVRRFVKRALERRGFEILEAADGAEALHLVKSHRGPIDAVVTDVDMPQMSGIEFARELARSHPETPVLFLSGSSRDFLDDPDAQQALGHFLQKPFTEEAIIDELRRLIAAAESR
jgi:PAS domain S-box-containing protein